jgi:hypothetical protein
LRPNIFARAGILLVVAALVVACGSRSDLDAAGSRPAAGGGVPSEGRPAATCTVAPSCPDAARGTWRLEDVDRRVRGYFFTFDGRGTCNETEHSFLLMLGQGESACFRNGDYRIEEDTPTTFRFSADGLGGSDGPECGRSDPGLEDISVALTRDACDPTTYAFDVRDSAARAPFQASFKAVRCRCDIAWRPCAEAAPADPCAP